MFGGLVVDAVGWREIFLVPVPICVVSLLLGVVFLPSRTESLALPRFDWFGYILLCAALVLLLAAGANGPRYGWGSDLIVMMMVVGIACASSFVALQLRSDAPLLDFSLFKVPQFAAAVVVSFVFGVGNFASNYLIPVFGRVADTLPAHLMVMTGLVLFAFGNFLMAGSDVNTSFLTLVLCLVVARFGMALIMPSMSTAALRSLTSEQLNKGSGTVNFCRQLGGAFGITSVVVFIGQRTQFHSEAMIATQTSSNVVSRELLTRVETLFGEAGLPEAARHPAALDYLGQVVHAQASNAGFTDAFAVIAVVFLLALIPAWVLGRVRKRGPSG
jgi:MFS family permease